MERFRGDHVLSAAPEAQKNQKGHAFFFSGINGKYPGLRSIQGALEKNFGQGNATVYNSAFFAERPDENRYQRMAQKLKGELAEGPVTIFGHSYGAVEAVRALSQDPEILQNETYRNNLRIILLSPVFNTGLFNGLKNVVKFGKVMVQEAMIFGRAVPGQSSIVSGIVSAGNLASDVLPYDVFRKAARIASPKLSHRSSEIDFLPQRDYFNLLDDKTKDLFRANDRRIGKAVEDGKRRKLRKEFRRRGRIARPVAKPIFEGKYADTFGDPKQINPYSGTRAEANRLRRRLIKESVYGRDIKMFNAMLDLNLDIWVGVAEQDLMNSITSATRLLRGRRDRVFTTSFTTHGSPWSTQPEILDVIEQSCR